MNIVHIAGFLGSDPIKTKDSKGTIFRVGSKVRKNKMDDTIWWSVTVWGDQFDGMISYLRKGSAVIIVGNLRKPEIFIDRMGNPQVSMSLTATNIMFSPFGRSEKPQETAVKEEKSELYEEKAEPSNDDEEYAGFSQGKAEIPDISDSEVPF